MSFSYSLQQLRVLRNKLASLYLSICCFPSGAWAFSFRGLWGQGRKRGRTAAHENMVSSFARSSQAKAPCYGLEEMLGRWKHLHVPTLTIQRCQPPATKVPVMLSSMAWRSSVKLGQVRQIWFAPCLCTSPAVKLLATYSDSLCFRFPVCKTRVTEGPSPSGTDMILEILLREE